MVAQRTSKTPKRKASSTKSSSKATPKKSSASSGTGAKSGKRVQGSGKGASKLANSKLANSKLANSKPTKKAAAKAVKPPKASKDKERARIQKERERALKEKEKLHAERERAEREREKLRAAKEKEKLLLSKQKEKERALKEKEKERQRELKEREKLKAQEAKQREAEKKKKEAERALALKAAAEEAERRLAEKEEQKAREKAEKEEQKAREKAEKEEQKAREKAEKDAEREREKVEREAERIRLKEEATRKREEELATKKAAQDAYRKAKESEKSRIRADREAARRALEGRVAKAVGKGMRGAARTGNATTVRVYNPAVIPDQSRTRRSVMDQDPYAKFANLRAPKIVPGLEGIIGEPPRPRTIPPPPPEAPPESIEERYALVTERLKKVDDAFRKDHEENFLMSWIYHDSALEGMVYTYEELRTAINPNITVVPDSSMQSVVDEIRRHKAAIDLVLELGDKKRAPVSIDVVKRLYLTLHPEEGDLKTVKYRKDIPQHRLYFHEYAAPDKIAYKIRQVFDWLNGPEPKKLKSALKVAARVHYDLLRVFPFPNDSGKVSRLLMNVLLLRSDHPPAIIHSTERQRYYEALRGSLATIISMTQESILNALQSIEKKLDEHDTRMKAFVS